MASNRVTIQDLADSLGLSKFSVSRALSGKPGVGEATRNRVIRAAHSMGYRVNQDVNYTAGHILFIRQEIDPVSSELWLNIMHGAEQEGEKLGFSILPRQARHLNDAAPLDSSIVGIILAVPRPSEWSALAARTGLPVVCASYASPMEQIDQVVGADWESGYGVARMLAGLGHRNMAFVHGSATPMGRAERFRGFRDGASTVEDAVVDDIVFDESEGFRSTFFRYLRSGKQPTALFCAHDGIAIAVISELLRLGIRVPEDVSVVGFNDFASATHMSPRMTTVRTPQVEMGAAMVRCIAERMASADARNRPPVRLALVSEIIERESAAQAGKTDWLARVLEAAG
ncbi:MULTISPECIES: LacI family DNA-binding transcriptional regulator [unclassified Sinorhizobium]|uniref:LacI family DNA-binding transcriptional regulator n=1 Tax=unclassified Sinorhizobium TaxID=2613772 RepID=UPI0024C4275F|nr:MULTISPECIES: LacI family DNA-binding transcriptional regulator [unclassified Sinorhizobium]MDK1373653.1 LacI family DNA-binding transcriptional regulator [Sinorhizobium sp. 6-70]MDK1477786.1 LacI family DNA-binding transcriptional regulator [Sinorhizobium sp. 6-117]